MTEIATTNQQPRRRKTTSHLFQLAWLLIFLAVSIFLLVPRISSGPPRRRQEHLAIEVSNLAQAVELFKMEIGCYPPDFSESDEQDQEQINQVLIRFENHKESDLATARSLDPAEALVFWLGSCDSAKTLIGSDKQPFFEFDLSRLQDRDSDGFEEYYPPVLQSPYVYLHPRLEETEFIDNQLPSKRAILNGMTQVRPYCFQRGLHKMIPVQIICAGRDDHFGNGGVFPDSIGYSVADEDNLANFSNGQSLDNCIP